MSRWPFLLPILLGLLLVIVTILLWRSFSRVVHRDSSSMFVDVDVVSEALRYPVDKVDKVDKIDKIDKVSWNNEVSARDAREDGNEEVARLDFLLRGFGLDSSRWDNLVAIGDIYRRGSYPRFSPNEALAIECFKLAAMCPRGDIAGVAQMKYLEAHADAIAAQDRTGDRLPPEYGWHACELARGYIRSTPVSLFERPVFDQRELWGPNEDLHERLVRHDDNQLETDLFGPDFARENAVIVLPRRDPNGRPLDTTTTDRNTTELPAFRIDTQNVHDHSVASITRMNIAALQRVDTSTSAQDDQTACEAVRDSILTSVLPAQVKSDALQTLDDLKSSPNATLGASELHVLGLAWRRIADVADTEKRANLAEVLAKQLASGVERGHVVCSTGKIARIIGVFDGFDMLKTSRPMWVVREELASLATKTREAFLAGLSESDRAEYKRGGRKDVEDAMRGEFERRALTEYRDTLGMAPAIIEPLVATYKLGF
jgi:propanediol dehydratase small subunit